MYLFKILSLFCLILLFTTSVQASGLSLGGSNSNATVNNSGNSHNNVNNKNHINNKTKVYNKNTLSNQNVNKNSVHSNNRNKNINTNANISLNKNSNKNKNYNINKNSIKSNNQNLNRNKNNNTNNTKVGVNTADSLKNEINIGGDNVKVYSSANIPNFVPGTTVNGSCRTGWGGSAGGGNGVINMGVGFGGTDMDSECNLRYNIERLLQTASMIKDVNPKMAAKLIELAVNMHFQLEGVKEAMNLGQNNSEDDPNKRQETSTQNNKDYYDYNEQFDR